METFPASADVADRTIHAPLYKFRFDKYFDAPDREFFSYLAVQKNILDFEAIKWYNEFSSELRSRIRTEEQVSWDGVGILKKDAAGNMLFESVADNGLFMTPAPAMRVNRHNASHTLLVGDQEKTNFEMNEWLSEEAESRRDRTWWIIAIVLGAIALGILAWQFYSSGWSIGNQQHL